MCLSIRLLVVGCLILTVPVNEALAVAAGVAVVVVVAVADRFLEVAEAVSLGLHPPSIVLQP